jgi:hypothetical protein
MASAFVELFYACAPCILGCIGGVIVFAWMIGSVFYLVSGISRLSGDHSVANDCKHSNLWSDLLMLLILNAPVYSSFICCLEGSSCFNIKAVRCFCVYIFIINGIFAYLIGVELYDGNMCDELSHTRLHTYAEIMFVVSLILSGLAFLFFVVLMCVACCLNSDAPIRHGRNTTVAAVAAESPWSMAVVETETVATVNV